jgi:protease-4
MSEKENHEIIDLSPATKEKNIFLLQTKDLKKKIFLTNMKVWGMGIFLAFEVIVLYSFGSSSGFLPDPIPDGDKIAVINFNKEITETSVEKTIASLDKITKDKSYKEILFIMNSPGGSPAASEELSEYLKEINKQKHITMYVESIAASGGYYIASAIKPLNSNQNAIVGSIGVIMEHYNFEQLAKKIGVEDDYFAKGNHKKPISFLKKISPSSKEYLDDYLLSPMYSNFIKAVSINRGISVNEIKKVAGGKVYIANDPRIKNILVDKITSLYKVKYEIKKKYKDVEFVEVTESKEGVFSGLSGKVNLNLNIENLDSLKATSKISLK